MPISRQAPSSLCFLVFRCSIFKVRYHPLSRTALLLYHTHSSLSSLFSFFLEKISNRFCVTRSRGQLCYFSTFIRLCQHIFLIFFSFFLLLSFLIILFCEIVDFIQKSVQASRLHGFILNCILYYSASFLSAGARMIFTIIPRIRAAAIEVTVTLPNWRVSPPIPAMRIVEATKRFLFLLRSTD